MDRLQLDPEIIAGRRLYGNDFNAEQLRAWYAAEEYGYYDLYRADADLAEAVFPYAAVNAADGAPLRGRHYPVCLVLGCAEGDDLLALGLDIGRLIAIEPADQCWADRVGTIPAEFRKPTLDGTIALEDGTVDLVVCLSVLHHIANVEFVVSELGRVLKPGGTMLVREPISSMGDFRAPRRGLTRYERGIPAAMMQRFLEAAGLAVERRIYRDTPGLPELAKRFGIVPYNSPAIVALDRAISALSRFNDRYWRPRLINKLAPRWAAFIARKRG